MFESLESRQLLSASTAFAPASLPHGASVAAYTAFDNGTTSASLDSTFGTNGVVETPVKWQSNVSPAVAIEPDGKILLAGGGASDANDPNFGTRVLRLNPDGTLDAAFGNQGIVRIDDGMGTDWCIAVQPDGKIVIGTSVWASNATINTGMLYRLNANGTIDTTFGNGGSVPTPCTMKSMSLESNGDILVAGNNQTTLMVVRYLADGTADASFGADGQTIVAQNYYYPTLHVLAGGADGRLVLAGTYSVLDPVSYSLAGFKSFITRLNADGSPDLTLNRGSPITRDVSGNTTTAALLPDGSILTANTGSTLTLTRYNFDGSLDLSFGDNGTSTDSLGNNFSSGPIEIALRSTGEIVVGGFTQDVTSGGLVEYTGHFTPDGKLLTSQRSPIATNLSISIGFLTDETLDSQGRLVSAGYVPHQVNGNWINTLTAIRLTGDDYTWAGDPSFEWAAYPYETLPQQVRGSLTVKVGLDKKAIKATRTTATTSVAALRQTLHHDQAAYRAAVRLERRLAHTPGQQAAAQAQAATISSLSRTLKSDHAAILTFRRSGLHNVFAAEQALRVDIARLHRMK